MAHWAVSGARPCVFRPARVFPAPMVDMGDGACADQVLAGPCGPVGAGAPRRRRYRDRASWAQGVWPGTASRWRAVVSHRSTADRWGHTWVAISGLVKRPFARRPWALPVVVAWYRPPEWDRAHGTRQKTPAHCARRLLARLIRGFPQRHVIFVGDMGYGTRETARFCPHHRRHLTIVSQCYGDAAWDAPPPPRTCHTMGRPRVQGRQWASPQEVVAKTATRTRLMVAWSGGTTRAIEVVTGTGHWYRIGEARGEVRWVYAPDGTGTHGDEHGLTTALRLCPQRIVACYPPRWSIETTFQACRAYLKRASPPGYGQQKVFQSC